MSFSCNLVICSYCAPKHHRMSEESGCFHLQHAARSNSQVEPRWLALWPTPHRSGVVPTPRNRELYLYNFSRGDLLSLERQPHPFPPSRRTQLCLFNKSILFSGTDAVLKYRPSWFLSPYYSFRYWLKWSFRSNTEALCLFIWNNNSVVL